MSLVSCKEMDFNYKQFIEGGETVYVGRADSLLVMGGNQRAELRWLLVSDPKISSYKIFWNNRADSLVGNLQKTEQVDTVRVLLDNLEEKTHEFAVYHFDENGNSSVRTSVISRVYGEKYRSVLINRALNSHKRLNTNQLQITWNFADAEFLFSEIKYNDINGQAVLLHSDREKEADTLRNFAAGQAFELRSAFKPVLGIDTFYTDFTVTKLEE